MKRRAIYLNEQHFIAMIMVALAVHLMLGVSWQLMPRARVNKVPVHVLNIKLGSGDAIAMGHAGDSPEASNMVSATPRGSREFAAAKAPKHASPKMKDNVTRPTPSGEGEQLTQYYRKQGTGGGRGGSALGNSASSDAQVMQRYTQLISMWINRNKGELNKALEPGMRGNFVVRLRVDRSGRIHYFKLDKATGVPSLDAAAVEMIRKSNPVPPVPRNYPGGNMFEFLIPVGYKYES